MFFFFNDTATTEIYTLSLHDALPISDFWRKERRDRGGFMGSRGSALRVDLNGGGRADVIGRRADAEFIRSEEHTSELQSHLNLVCRLLLEKKKTEAYPCDTLTRVPIH